MSGPAMVLVAPQMGENIGAAARAMWNFGLDDLRLVDPRDGWPNPRAIAMASGAARVLDRAQAYESTVEAVADLNYVYATTARPREMIKTVFTPEGALADAQARINAGEKVGFLFGRERTGLENDDVARANAIVTVPTNPAFSSLNLAQCVLLVAYEWGRRAYGAEPETLETGKRIRLAERAEVTRFADFLEAELDRAGFFFPEEKKPHVALTLRNLLHRAPFTDQDVRMLYGAVRALAHPRRRGED